MQRAVRSKLTVEARGRGRRLAAGTSRTLAARLRRAIVAAGLVGVELSLSLSDDVEMHALNLAYANEDHATDVLSFAQAEGPHVPHAGRRPLGDIVISVEYAARQAKTAGHTLPAELFHLAVHGLVHLLGYDHRDAREERVMFGYETALRRSALTPGPIATISAPSRTRRSL
ncbi:MAG: rRNA maturation RNase YbeY [Polyangia bacterium]